MTQPGRRRSTGGGARNSRSAGRRLGRLIWDGLASSSSSTVVADGGTTIVGVLPQSLAESMFQSTIRRMLGNVIIKATVLNVATKWRVGIMIVTGDALTAGAVPEPWADPVQWMYERTGSIVSSDLEDGSQFDKFDIDTRVMRKMPQADQSLVIIFESLTGAFEFFFGLKVLYYSP